MYVKSITFIAAPPGVAAWEGGFVLSTQLYLLPLACFGPFPLQPSFSGEWNILKVEENWLLAAPKTLALLLRVRTLYAQYSRHAIWLEGTGRAVEIILPKSRAGHAPEGWSDWETHTLPIMP